VRLGTTIGEHKVQFAWDDDVIDLTHQAGSRDSFANGALIAASVIAKAQKKPGFHDMDYVWNLIETRRKIFEKR